MASNINTLNIDAEYPKPGEDNSSQGFRDNFDSIKNNLDTAKSELEDLQENTARTDRTTDFNGSTIFNANFNFTTTSTNAVGNVDEDTLIFFSSGQYQTITIAEDVTLALVDWPDVEGLSSIRLAITTDGPEREATIATEGSGNLKLPTNFDNPITIPNDTDPVILEFWTIDSGETVFGNYLGQFI